MFIAHNLSLEFITQLRPLMPSIKRADANLADQIGRAATSIALNLAEGRCRAGGDQKRFYTYAHGSASEVKSAIAVGVAWGWIESPEPLLATLDRLMAMLWRLTHDRV
jgi:four helix bundle protein